MRRVQRILLLTVLAAAMPVIAGCSNFDPDNLDVFGVNEKKKMPGQRQALFPDGVPGVAQGIPPEYMKGYHAEQQQQAQQQQAELEAAAQATEAKKKTAAVTPAAKPKPRVASKPKPAEAPKTASQPAAQPQTQASSSSPWPAASTPQQGGAAPWPASTPQQGADAPWPSAAKSTTAPWPEAPPPNTFSR